jgi:hypothetical protein
MRLIGAGAQLVDVRQGSSFPGNPDTWTVMRDPGGNELRDGYLDYD